MWETIGESQTDEHKEDSRKLLYLKIFFADELMSYSIIIIHSLQSRRRNMLKKQQQMS